MTEERMMELLNKVIDHFMEENKLDEAIKQLILIGFSGDELIKYFNLPYSEVSYVELHTPFK